jgi:hypothetical protein
LLTERSIINFLVWIAGMIIGPYLVGATLVGNLIPLFVTLAICFLVFMFGLWRDKLCLLPLLGTYIGGKLTFLPLQIAPSDLCAVALIVYYLITYTALQRKKVHTGPLIFFISISAIAAIILYHEHDMGLRSMGNGRQGARGALFILLSSLAYLCGVSVDSLPPRFLARFPLYCILVSLISNIPFFVTTFLPRTVPYFYLITDNVNGSAYLNDVDGTGVIESGGQAAAGTAITVYLLSYYPIGTWWRPNRWWVVLLAAISLYMVVNGGYRSMLVGYGFIVTIAICSHYSWRALVIIPIVVLGLSVTIAAHDGHLIHLPVSAQRALSFLPGDWDQEASQNAQDSIAFRERIQKTYASEYAGKSPLFGNGLSYDAGEFDEYGILMKVTYDPYYESKLFITGKMFHNGWLSVYDSIGYIGSALFVTLGLSLIWKSGQMVFAKGADHKGLLFPLKIWLFANVLTTFVSYFAVFGDIKFCFPVLCFYAVLWTQINRVEQRGYKSVPVAREFPFDSARSGLPVSV